MSDDRLEGCPAPECPPTRNCVFGCELLAVCTCPPDRNGPYCPVHGHVWLSRAAKERFFIETAWELDLNWATDRVDRLFWQHERLSMWRFDYSSLRDRVRDVQVSEVPYWITAKAIAHAHPLYTGFYPRGSFYVRDEL